MAAGSPTSQPYASRQFSLAGLLSFVLACAIYFGLLSTTAAVLGERYFTIYASPWRLFGTVVISWAALFALYRCWKLKGAVTIHYTGPITCGIVALAALAICLLTDAREPIGVFLVVLMYGPFISVLFGFPVVVVMLIYRLLKRD